MNIYQRGNVTVDEHFARFGSKSYAISKITSVDMREDIRSNTGSLVALFVLGGVLGLVSLPLIADLAFVGFMLAMAACLCIYFGIRSSQAEPFRLYTLMLSTSAGEVQATTSQDVDAINELRGEIEARIVQSR